jgi:hypothetical protein
MNANVWVGAVTTLLGVALGSSFGLLLTRRQARDARELRRDDAAREDARRREERKFHAYAEFLTRCRTVRNAARSGLRGRNYMLPETQTEIDGLIRTANDASVMVFLVRESDETSAACRRVLRVVDDMIERFDPNPTRPWPESWIDHLGRFSGALRAFQEEARQELRLGEAVTIPALP